MAKRSLRTTKKLQKLQEKQLLLEERSKRFLQQLPIEEKVEEKPHKLDNDDEELLMELIHVDSMLRQQSYISETQFATDANHLLQVIKSQHIGLETLLARQGVDIVSTPSGSDFNADFMEADPRVIDTADEQQHGMVARSVTPLFLRKGSDPIEQRVLQYERVILYNFKN